MEKPMSLPQMDFAPTLLTPRDAADYLGLSQSTLARMRSSSSAMKGPPFSRLGGSIRYKQSDLDEWVERNRHDVDNVLEASKDVPPNSST